MTERTYSWLKYHTDRLALSETVDKILQGPSSFAGDIMSEIFCGNANTGFKLMSRDCDSETICVAVQVLQEALNE